MRTSNNLIVLKTLIDKQFHKNEKLYCCFADFSKAFDAVWRKHITLDSNGKFHTTINEFSKKAAKAAGRLYKLSTFNYISIKTWMGLQLKN